MAGLAIARPKVAGEKPSVGLEIGSGCRLRVAGRCLGIGKPWARSSMAEQLTLNQRVEGSSPSGLTTTLNVKRPSDSGPRAFSDFSYPLRETGVVGDQQITSLGPALHHPPGSAIAKIEWPDAL